MKLDPSKPDRFQANQRLHLKSAGGGSTQEEEGPAIDLRAMIMIVWRAKWIILICTICAGVLGLISASQIGPRYQAVAKVMFGFQRANVTNFENVLVDQTFDNAGIQDQIEILRSTVLTERVIEELKLDQSPVFNPTLVEPVPTLLDRIRDSVSLPPEINDFLRGSETGIESGIEAEITLDTTERDRIIRLAVINNVLADLRLVPIGQSRVIAIGYTSGDPKLSARIANSYAEQYIVDQLEAKLEATNSATSWLSERVEELRFRVEDAEVAIEEAMLEITGEDGQSLEVTQRQLEALNLTLAEVTADRTRLQALYERLTNAIAADMDLGTISEFRQSGLIQGYRSQEVELRSQLASLRSTVPEGHPSITRVEQQINEVRRNVSEEADRIVSATFLDLEALKTQEEKLLADVSNLEREVVRQTGDQSKVRQLEREAEAARTLYNSFLTRLQETTAQQDLQESDARLLSPAEIPLSPLQVARNRTLIAITIFGMLVGIGIAFLRDRLNNTFRSPMELEELTGENLLGVLPTIGARQNRRDVIKHLQDEPGSALVEAVRNLRTSILFSNIDTPPKVVMFTSSVPREGKSTTSMLTALTSRQMGKTAVIVDCDLRLPALADLLNAKDHTAGLIAVLEGSATVEEAVYKDEVTGLHVLTTVGSFANSGINAADILSSKKFEDLIATLSDMYDLVILDTPPTLVVADARIVSKVADAIVYSVKYDDTPRGAVVQGIKELRGVDAPLIGVVLTLVNERRASQYYYSGQTYYKGMYRDYYSN